MHRATPDKNAQRIYILLALCALILLLPLATRPNITGNTIVQLYEHEPYVRITKTHAYTVEIPSDAWLSSFSISGRIRGEGIAEVTLHNSKGNTARVFRNTRTGGKGLWMLTGAFTRRQEHEKLRLPGTDLRFTPTNMPEPAPNLSLQEYEVTFQGEFIEQCDEACDMTPEIGSGPHTLLVAIGPDTELTLEKITYRLGG